MSFWTRSAGTSSEVVYVPPPPPVPASEFQTLTRDQFLKKFVNKVDDFIVCFSQTWGDLIMARR